jgi:hypothetical protein
MLPSLKCSYQSIQLLVIHWIVQFWSSQHLTEICNGLPFAWGHLQSQSHLHHIQPQRFQRNTATQARGLPKTYSSILGKLSLVANPIGRQHLSLLTHLMEQLWCWNLSQISSRNQQGHENFSPGLHFQGLANPLLLSPLIHQPEFLSTTKSRNTTRSLQNVHFSRLANKISSLRISKTCRIWSTCSFY